MPITKIKKYEVIYASNGFAPRIWLKDEDEYIGQLIFQPDNSVLPTDHLAGARVQLYYHLANFPHVLDLLRNEKPVYLLYSGSGGGFENAIKTVTERVGEGE